MGLPLHALKQVIVYNYGLLAPDADVVSQPLLSAQTDVIQPPTMSKQAFRESLEWLDFLNQNHQEIDSPLGLCQGDGNGIVSWREVEAFAALSEKGKSQQQLDEMDYLIFTLPQKPTLHNQHKDRPSFMPVSNNAYRLQQPATFEFWIDNKGGSIIVPQDFVSNGFNLGTATDNYRRFSKMDPHRFQMGVLHDYLLQQLGKRTSSVIKADPSFLRKFSETIDQTTVHQIMSAVLAEDAVLTTTQEKMLAKNTTPESVNQVQQLNASRQTLKLPQPNVDVFNTEGFILKEDYSVQVDDVFGQTYKITVPAGYASDGASLPRAARAFGFVNDGYMLSPSLVHDYLYEYHSTLNTDWRQGTVQQKQPDGSFKPIEAVSRRTADGIFKAMMKANDVPANGAVQHAAVRLFSNAPFLHYNWDDFTKAHEAADRAVQKTAQYNQPPTTTPKD